jgi:hypothetical protein
MLRGESQIVNLRAQRLFLDQFRKYESGTRSMRDAPGTMTRCDEDSSLRMT